MGNIIIARFDGTQFIRTRPIWQYSYGQKLRFEGVDLPENYEVHFANAIDGTSVNVTAGVDGVTIPDSVLEDGKNVFAWVYETDTGDPNSDEDDSGETEYMVTIPIRRRAKPPQENNG